MAPKTLKHVSISPIRKINMTAPWQCNLTSPRSYGLPANRLSRGAAPASTMAWGVKPRPSTIASPLTTPVMKTFWAHAEPEQDLIADPPPRRHIEGPHSHHTSAGGCDGWHGVHLGRVVARDRHGTAAGDVAGCCRVHHGQRVDDRLGGPRAADRLQPDGRLVDHGREGGAEQRDNDTCDAKDG